MLSWDELEYLWRQGRPEVEATIKAVIDSPYSYSVDKLWGHFNDTIRPGDSFLVQRRPECWLDSLALRWTAYFEFGEDGPHGRLMFCYTHAMEDGAQVYAPTLSVSPLDSYYWHDRTPRS